MAIFTGDAPSHPARFRGMRHHILWVFPGRAITSCGFSRDVPSHPARSPATPHHFVKVFCRGAGPGDALPVRGRKLMARHGAQVRDRVVVLVG